MRTEEGDTRARSWSRRKVAVGLGAVVLLVAAIALPASGKVAQKGSSARAAVTVTVTAGKPSELGFKLSSKKVAAGKVTFKVTNAGVLDHSFKVCTSAKGGAANACLGKATPILKHGKSATLTVLLTKGIHEYLCTVPGHAAGGMKGLLGVGVAVPATSANASASAANQTTSTTSSSSTTTTTANATPPPPATATLIGDPVAGKLIFTSQASPPCATCHTLKNAGSTATVGPNLDSLAPDQGTVVNAVTYGLPGGMPAFGAPGGLSAAQINNVAAYVYQSTHQ
jgi:mono/diheme cytochrome c family protein